jgi:REP element-mobilizing transposase RayT
MRYDRRLPHYDVIGERVFVTFRLHGSLPHSRVFPGAHLTSGQEFVAMDRLLDNAKRGPFFLTRPEIAEMVVDALHQTEQRFERYELHSYVVMPNHVHLLVTSRVPLRNWLRSLKGFTGHAAIRMIGLRTPFWQDENYDRLVRGDDECRRIKRYIEWNPVKAGLAAAPEDFPFSSATPGRNPAAGSKAWAY